MRVDMFTEFGNGGIEFLNEYESAEDEGDDDCSECGEISEEFILSIIEEYDGELIPCSVIDQAVSKLTDDGSEVLDITNIVKKKILFHGIINGWLSEEYFLKDKD